MSASLQSQALAKSEPCSTVSALSGFDPSRLRTEPDPARRCCWCGGWGHFYNTAKEPPELTFCGNCEDAAKGNHFAGLSELEQDLMLARLGDYPGGVGCRRIAAAYDNLRAAAESVRKLVAESRAIGAEGWSIIDPINAALATEAGTAETENTGSVHEGAGLEEATPMNSPTNPPQDAVERVERELIACDETNTCVAGIHREDLRTILSLLKPDDEMVARLSDDECAICGKPKKRHSMSSGYGVCQIYPVFVSKRQIVTNLFKAITLTPSEER